MLGIFKTFLSCICRSDFKVVCFVFLTVQCYLIFIYLCINGDVQGIFYHILHCKSGQIFTLQIKLLLNLTSAICCIKTDDFYNLLPAYSTRGNFCLKVLKCLLHYIILVTYIGIYCIPFLLRS